MSTGSGDYIIFDYLRYAQDILPAIGQLEQGNQQPLHALIIEDLHQTSSPALPHLSDERSRDWRWTGCLLDTLTRHQELSIADPLDWDKLFNNIVSLRDIGTDDGLLKTYLLTTYCCEVLPWSPDWNWPYHGRFLLDHDEWISDWQAYTCRDEEQATLWEAFSQPAPEPLGRHLQIGLQKLDPYARVHFPRSISTPHLNGSISGFMTTEEIQRLLGYVRTHEMPHLDQLAWRIEWWKQTQPEKVEEYRQQYWQRLWMIEEEILYRMRYALSHGKGILTYYVN